LKRPLGWRHLFKRPVIRQYIRAGTLWREREEREPSRFELFFDLIFVGIIHQLADGSTEVFSGSNVAKFIVLFFPSWTVWQDTRAFVNMSGTDDTFQRLYILFNMGLLLGYSANASAIEFPSSTAGSDDSDIDKELGLPTLRAAVLFFLVARLVRLALTVVYALYLPKFRKAQLYSALGIFLQSAFYFPLIWVRSNPSIWTLMSLGIVCEIVQRYSAGLIAQPHRWRNVNPLVMRANAECIPAYNIEHHIERQSQFVIVVLGEAVLNLTYQAFSPQTGLHREFARSVMGLMSAYFFCWLYFDQGVSVTFIHALRRHWFTAVSANYLHFPLCGGLIIWSASLKLLVQNATVETGVKWYLGGGLAVATFTLALLGWMHKNLDVVGSSCIPPDILLSMRVGAAVIFALLPLGEHLNSSLSILAIHTGVLATLVIFSTVGKVGAMPALLEEPPGVERVPVGNEGETEEEAREVDKDAQEFSDNPNNRQGT